VGESADEKGLLDKARETAEGLVERAKPAVDSARQKAEPALEKTKPALEKAKPALDKAGKAAGELLDRAAKRLKKDEGTGDGADGGPSGG
jgi:ElaB/YqjD/DUF883 family membrane-anchored ribosome-binding protein